MWPQTDAQKTYLAAIKASIVADQKGFGPAIEAAWCAVEKARADMVFEAESMELDSETDAFYA